MLDKHCIAGRTSLREPGQLLAEAEEVAPGGRDDMVARVESPAVDKGSFGTWPTLGSDQVGCVLGEPTDIPLGGLVGDLVDGMAISCLFLYPRR